MVRSLGLIDPEGGKTMPKTWPGRPAVTSDALQQRAAVVRLPLSAEHAAALVAQVEMQTALLDALAAAPVGETAPSVAYSPRWPE
jgi:hypothetical protein